MPLVSAGPTETCVKAPNKSLEHSGSVVVPPISKDPVMLGPNITGHIQESGDTLDEEGCFYLLSRSGGWVYGGSGGIRKVVGFDASRSSTEYGRSSEVQVASVRTLPCIKS